MNINRGKLFLGHLVYVCVTLTLIKQLSANPALCVTGLHPGEEELDIFLLHNVLKTS